VQIVHKSGAVLACAAALLLFASADAARAEIGALVVDAKQWRAGDPPLAPGGDSVQIIDMAAPSPRVVGKVGAETSMIGPPTSVAVSSDERFAVITAAQAVEPGDPPFLVFSDTVSMIDLADPRAPKVVQTVKAGPGASGVSINRAGTLALVASTGDDTVSIFRIAGRRLTPAGKIRLPYQSRPTDVAISPDGRTALVVMQNAGRIVRLTIDGSKVSRSGSDFAVGVQPYGVVFSPDGAFAYNTNLQGRPPAPGATASGPRVGAITAIDLRAGQIAGFTDVGVTPEHLVLSPDGAFLAVTLINGTISNPTSPSYNPFGLLKVFRVKGPTLELVAETRTGPWCQGAAWRKDGSAILQLCAERKEIEVYRFDGARLTRDAAATLSFDSRPGSLSTAWGR
jgi:hypothetical protein